jgi:hypothetical protein
MIFAVILCLCRVGVEKESLSIFLSDLNMIILYQKFSFDLPACCISLSSCSLVAEDMGTVFSTVRSHHD